MKHAMLPTPAHTTEASRQSRIALVAHPTRVDDLLAWAHSRRTTVGDARLCAAAGLRNVATRALGRPLECLPCLLADRRTSACGLGESPFDLLVFFWAAGEPHPQDADVRALLRVAIVHDIPIACTATSADYMLDAGASWHRLTALLPTFDERRWAPELVVEQQCRCRSSPPTVEGRRHRPDRYDHVAST